MKKLIYLYHTRPDIAFAISVVSYDIHSPKEAHLKTVYKICKYLKWLPSILQEEWSHKLRDLHWCRLDWLRYYTIVFENLVMWRSKKWNVVVKSIVEVEFRTIAQRILKGLWLKKLLMELYIVTARQPSVFSLIRFNMTKQNM